MITSSISLPTRPNVRVSIRLAFNSLEVGPLPARAFQKEQGLAITEPAADIGSYLSYVSVGVW